VRVLAPLALAGALTWWHAIHFWGYVQRGIYLREALVVWAYVLAGSVAWSRRPRNATGLLMIGLGIAWAVPFLPPPGALAPVWFTLATALGALPVAVLGHLCLAFPDGTLPGRPARGVVVIGYLVAGVVPLLSVVTCAPGSVAQRCNFSPNALTVLPAAGVSETLARVGALGSAAFLIAVVGLVVRRWWRASGPARRALLPVWLSTFILVVTSLDVARRTWVQLDLADWGLSYVPGEGSEALLYVRAAGHVLVPLAFLVGLLRVRISRLAAATLARKLQETVGSPALQDALATALGDPGARVAYWLPADERYADAAGEVITLPGPGSAQRTTTLERKGQRLGVLIHDRMVDPELVDDVSAVAGLALENERLAVEVRAQLRELRRAQSRIVEAGDTARRHLERDLHDGAQQRLVTLGLALQEAQLRHGAADPSVTETFAALGAELRGALAELREFARGVHPAVLTSDGLGPALRERVRHAGVAVEVSDLPDQRFPQAVEATAYFVVVEALTNAAKHAAASRATLTVRPEGDVLRVELCDDGRGSARLVVGSGLQGLRDRVIALGGTFELTSPPGSGTTVRAFLPLASRD
jgi:signal transduction histidine kinase